LESPRSKAQNGKLTVPWLEQQEKSLSCMGGTDLSSFSFYVMGGVVWVALICPLFLFMLSAASGVLHHRK